MPGFKNRGAIQILPIGNKRLKIFFFLLRQNLIYVAPGNYVVIANRRVDVFQKIAHCL